MHPPGALLTDIYQLTGFQACLGEPILRVSAPLPQAQLVESRLLDIVRFQPLTEASVPEFSARVSPGLHALAAQLDARPH